MNALWHKEGTSGQARIATTRDHLIGFPTTIDYKGLLVNATKLDIQINPLGLSELRSLPHFRDDSTRILVPGASYYQPTPLEQINLSRTGDNVRPTGEGVKWCIPTCSGEDFQRLRHQYIIIDESMVLCNYQGLHGLLLRNADEVKPFRDDFDANWSYPVLFDTADEMINALRSRESPAQLRAAAAYNLRHIAAPHAVVALVDSVSDPSDKVSRAAKASLEILGASEIAPMRYTVANIVFGKYKAMPSSVKSSGGEWMKEYAKRVQDRH